MESKTPAYKPLVFVLRWLLGTTVGLLLGTVLGQLIAQITFSTIPFSYEDLTVGHHTVLLAHALPIGLCLGIAQGLAIRPLLPLGRWVIASAVGFSVGRILGSIVGLASHTAPYEPTVALLIGLSMGYSQSVVLRHQTSWGLSWILMSVVGWGFMAFRLPFTLIWPQDLVGEDVFGIMILFVVVHQAAKLLSCAAWLTVTTWLPMVVDARAGLR